MITCKTDVACKILRKNCFLRYQTNASEISSPSVPPLRLRTFNANSAVLLVIVFVLWFIMVIFVLIELADFVFIGRLILQVVKFVILAP